MPHGVAARSSRNGDGVSQAKRPENETLNGGERRPSHHAPFFGLNFGAIRFGALFAIIGLSLASTFLLIYAGLIVLQTIWDSIAHAGLGIDQAKHLEVVFIELTDAFLPSRALHHGARSLPVVHRLEPQAARLARG